MLQDELIGLREPEVHASQGIVVEGADSKQSQAAVVHVQDLRALKADACKRGHFKRERIPEFRGKHRECVTANVSTHLLTPGQLSGAPQRLVRAFVGECRGKDLARLHVQSDTVYYRPMDAASHGGVQLAHAAERQVDLHRLLVESG